MRFIDIFASCTNVLPPAFTFSRGKTVEYGVRLDILAAVTTRAKLARALPHDELAGLRALARHAVVK